MQSYLKGEAVPAQGFNVDAGLAIGCGVLDSYPAAELEQCWYHVAKRGDALESLFLNPAPRPGIPGSGFPHFRSIFASMHLCRTLEQFLAVAAHLKELLTATGEPRVAQVFDEQFISSPTKHRWFCAAGGAPGKQIPDTLLLNPGP